MSRLVIRKSVYLEIMALLMRKAWVEGEHPRDEAGRFSPAPDNKMNPREGNREKEVRHDGEYVLTKDGRKDFGEIKAETGLPEGKIKLRIGKHTGDKGEKGDYGEKHIERPDRLAQLRKQGFDNARDLVEYTAKDFDAVYPGKGNAITIAKIKDARHDAIVYVELKAVGEGKFYDVASGLVADKKYMKNKKPLWVSPKSGLSKDGAVDATNPQRSTERKPLSPTSGSPSSTVSPESLKKSSPRLAAKRGAARELSQRPAVNRSLTQTPPAAPCSGRALF